MSVVLGGGFQIKEIQRKLNFVAKVSNSDNSRKENSTVSSFYPMIRCQNTTLFKNNPNNLTSNLFGDPNDFFCFPENFKDNLLGHFGNYKFIMYTIHLT
jgi:hypothetical protein